MSGNLTRYVDAWEQTIRSVAELAEGLSPADWDRATECPGWSVRDNVSHVIGLERELLGDPAPSHTLPRDLVHIRNEMGRYMEIAVDVRRHHTPAELVGELNDTIARRVKALREEVERRDPEEEVEVFGGLRRWTYEILLRNRAFDVWVHEQDIRRAVGRPGNLGAPAALAAKDVIVSALPVVVVKRAGAPAGSAVIFDVTGPVKFSAVVRVDTDGRGVLSPWLFGDPTARLTMDWETFARLGCGRVSPRTVHVTVQGDEELAGRVLDAMAVTP
ncbi:hypothetical protein TH66_20475 [Carbonactinospora thermoautotrophica]|uniref:Mycothiol-dependent maleylpyruvate isomerase metal-binding domain-containing protein n=1 Tax=Carbonactinospora thermoautotrophica TaxID=1469144 RepID=A0A132MKY8_9ACTN|nr:maleylpyruvate isomerase family mycothiol-dependent enzyme [Carbonactinospora thermoautotrophica]KWW97818.1 hypothetical protein TH66_20475 [Carbonactinospora thermoautotrophica]KWW98453.1 hypothetical protein LI90_73 [Carbonactinospora thermoautotrophica]KWX07907.1 hypothetical protein TR74_17145 [Carbonactinospora thermoautotrophica]